MVDAICAGVTAGVIEETVAYWHRLQTYADCLECNSANCARERKRSLGAIMIGGQQGWMNRNRGRGVLHWARKKLKNDPENLAITKAWQHCEAVAVTERMLRAALSYVAYRQDKKNV